MKFSIAIIALASMVLAGPPPKKQCNPPEYACLKNGQGWEVCTSQGQFVFGGNCPPKTVCKFYAPSQSPYCVPPGFTIG